MENLFKYEKERIYFQVIHRGEMDPQMKNDTLNRLFFSERSGLFKGVNVVVPQLSNVPGVQSEVLRGNFYNERYEINRSISLSQYVMQVQKCDGSKLNEDLIDMLEDIFLIQS